MRTYRRVGHSAAASATAMTTSTDAASTYGHGPRIFAQSGCNHRPEIVGGVEERRAAALLRGFFRERR